MVTGGLLSGERHRLAPDIVFNAVIDYFHH